MIEVFILLFFDEAKLQQYKAPEHGQKRVLFVQIRDDGNSRFIAKGLRGYLAELFKYPAKIKFVLEFKVVGYFFNALPG
jgi:hypothetical protein